MKQRPSPWRFFILGIAAAAAGCTVGPDYLGPPDAAPLSSAAGHFKRATPADTTEPPPQVARWWDALNDPVLTHVIDLSLAQSPNLQAAEARILEARAALAKQRAAAYPSATALGAAIRADAPAGGPLASLGSDSGSGSTGTTGTTGTTGASGSGTTDTSASGRTTFNLYTVGFDAIWELDIFGGVRRGVESARASAEAAGAQYEDAQVQLAAEVGRAYAALRGAQEQLALAERNLAIQQKLLDLTTARRRFGTADDLDIERARAQVLSGRASLVPLRGEVEQELDQLALLAGQEPGTLDATLSTPAPLPMPPASVPIGDPAAMLRRRPDVRAAEGAVASSNAQIGQAVAALFPKVTLFGNVGYTSENAHGLFNGDKLALVGGPALQWNFLNFGSTRSQIRQARAANQESIARYDQAVLAALQDAESSLSRFGHQRQSVDALTETRDSTVRAATLAQTRYAGGTATLLDALDADRQRVQADQNLAQARADLVRDYVALQKSLGLGWKPAPESELDRLETGAADTDSKNRGVALNP